MAVNNWILIQQKQNNSKVYSFTRQWVDYRNGFGSYTENYWLGNEQVHQLMSYGSYKLRIEMQSTSNRAWTWAEYTSFYLDSESANYSIHLSGFSGD